MHHHHEPVQSAGDSVILVTGGKHCGKTTLVADFVASLSGCGLRIAGILARGLWRDNLRAGFDLVNLSDGSVCPLARRRDHPDPHHHLMFDFLETGMRAGSQALDPRLCRRADMVVVDEVGKLEARGDGWAPHIKALLTIDPPLFILIVRLDCMQRIRDRFGFHDVPVIDARQPHAIDHLRSAAEALLVLRRK
jgi:nucleoside-triphosphatase THEP1